MLCARSGVGGQGYGKNYDEAYTLCAAAQIRQIYREEKKRDEDSTRLMFEK